MSDPFSARYWIEEFQVIEADLDRIEKHIQETNQAYDLTTLAQRVVHGRLCYGPERGSSPTQPEWVEDASVRLWDPSEKWEEGDHIIGTHFLRKDVYEVVIGEVVAVGPNKVRVQTEKVDYPVIYRRAEPGSADARKWHNHVKKVVAQKRQASTVQEQAEATLLTHGDRIGSRLLKALRADERFVRLSGRWFLRGLAAPAADEQLASLAWAMVPLEVPQSTADLVPFVEPPLVEGDPGLFGLYLAMRERAELFENADPGKRPRWVLAGPPPGSRPAQHAAYDPETYELLCLPHQPISPETVERLWDLELLRAVV